MGDWQDFGYKGAAGTCLWCGRKLRRTKVMANADEPGAVWQRGHYWLKPAKALGSYQDDSFCGLRCGYQFGLRMAQLDRRLSRRA